MRPVPSAFTLKTSMRSSNANCVPSGDQVRLLTNIPSPVKTSLVAFVSTFMTVIVLLQQGTNATSSATGDHTGYAVLTQLQFVSCRRFVPSALTTKSSLLNPG